MKCSDIQMVIASQLAYIDFNQAAVDSGQYTVRELLEMELESAGTEKRASIENVLKLMETEQGSKCADWVLKDVCNDQRNSGMYACMLETDEGEAMIAFRGSEDAANPDNLVKDWIGSDLGLLNNALTPQQAAAGFYMQRLYEKYGDEYNTFNLTGHSLGGNLAEHATITAPDGMRSKIERCLNLDGPGFSQTYLIAHANDIKKSTGIIDHYQWSAVGTLLNTVPGTNYRTVKAETPDDKGNMSILWRHDTKNIKEYDENGNMVSGEKDWLAQHTKEISNLLDFSICRLIPTTGLALLYNFADMTLDEIREIKERWKETFIQGNKVEFAVQANALSESMEQLKNMEETIRLIQMETENVRKALDMHSLSAGYIKYKLWRLESSMERQAKHMKDYSSKGEECVRLYQRYESTIAGNY